MKMMNSSCVAVLMLLLAGLSVPAAPGQIAFQKKIIDATFRSEGVAVADLNRDKRPDILAGNLWYEAPRWTPHEIRPPKQFNAAEGWSDCFQNYAADVNRDGWMDQIVFVFPGKEVIWRENPREGTGHWAEHVIYPNTGNESPLFARLAGVNDPALIFGVDESRMAWFESAPQGFSRHFISEANAPGTKKFAHGLGLGDVNGDGRPDVIINKGYWEAPADPRAGPWKFVPADLGPDCSYMYAMDVNADGLPDVVSSSAHNIGVWWYEQKRGARGPEFVQHVIDDTFSQSHALVAADLNGDGLTDLVTGKRFWAHGPRGDVRPNDPAVLYWFELQRSGGQIKWVRHEIDNDSGIGTQFVVADLNGDRRPDIVVSNKKGVFLFTQTGRK